MSEIESFKFDGKEYPVLIENGEKFIPVDQVCVNMGINPDAQIRLIKRSSWSRGRTTMMVVRLPSDDRARNHFFLDIRVVPMWIANIDTTRVKKQQARSNVELHQREFADALFDYVMHGVAVNPRATDAQVRQRVTEVLTKRRERLEAATQRAKALQNLKGMGVDEELKDKALVLLNEIMSGTHIWVWDYLGEKLSTPEEISEHVIKFGTRAAAYYRNERGVEPRKACRPGSNVPRNVYDEEDRYILDAAWDDYQAEYLP